MWITCIKHVVKGVKGVEKGVCNWPHRPVVFASFWQLEEVEVGGKFLDSNRVSEKSAAAVACWCSLSLLANSLSSRAGQLFGLGIKNKKKPETQKRKGKARDTKRSLVLLSFSYLLVR